MFYRTFIKGSIWYMKNIFQKIENSKEEELMKQLKSSRSETTALRNAIKRGVYMELYKKQMLTEQQLNELLAQAK